MMHRGDIVILNVPFPDGTGIKARPCLVVQADAYNGSLLNTVVATITSSKSRIVGAKAQLFIDISTSDGRRTGLHASSVAQMGQIDVCLKESLGIP